MPGSLAGERMQTLYHWVTAQKHLQVKVQDFSTCFSIWRLLGSCVESSTQETPRKWYPGESKGLAKIEK